jgi:hypothetical protein
MLFVEVRQGLVFGRGKGEVGCPDRFAGVKMPGKWVALILVAAIVPASAAIPEGTYSNVCMYPETGDLGGLQLEIKYSNGKPGVLLWICEGGCGWALITSELTTKGNQMSFTGGQEAISYPSRKVGIANSWRFTATMHDGELLLTSPTYEPNRQLLRRRVRIKPNGDRKAQPMAVGRCR